MPSTTDLFIKFPNKYFIETGTYRGRGVTCALRSGFYNIISIELDEQLFRDAKEKFAEAPEVTILHGASEKLLQGIIEKIPHPITFWLDGHFSGEGTAKGDWNCPLVAELEIIAAHPNKNHTILIDDRRLFETEQFDGLSEAAVREMLLRINPNYNIYYEDGGNEHADDVLVATPPKK